VALVNNVKAHTHKKQS